MKPPLFLNGRRNSPTAFSIVELLVVLAVIAILAAIAIPAFGPLMQSYNLNRGSSMISDELTYSRQAALSQDADVEVRLYLMGSAANTNDLQYRAFRAVLSATDKPMDKIKYLPNPVVLSSNIIYSTLLDYTNPNRSGLTSSQEVLPPGSTPTPYVSFKFRATGGTSLTPVTGPYGIWDLTLLSENTPTNSSGLPGNFVAVQIDPVTGTERTYRP